MNGLTPNQLQAIVGAVKKPPSFASLAEAVAWHEAEKAKRKGAQP